MSAGEATTTRTPTTRTPAAGTRALLPVPAGRTAVRRGLVPGAGTRVPVRRVPPPPAPPREPADPHRRQAVLTVLVLVLLTVFAGRLVYIQGFQGEAIAAKALQDRLSYAELIAARGQITDAHGKPLATSVERYTMHVNQRELAKWKDRRSDPPLAGPAGAAAKIAPILNMDPAELGAVLTGDAQYRVVQRDVLPAQVRAIRDLKIYSIGFDPTPKRVYPNGIVAGNLLGWVNREGQGASGLEALLDERLAGTSGVAVWERGRLGQEIPGGYQDGTSPQAGDSVQLTLLNDLQFYAQEAIDARVAETGASSGVIVVLDPRTGELLALADSGAVDPNQPSAGNLRGSSAISDVFEPGSTAKVVTMAAALELGLTTPTTPYEVPYQYTTANEQTFKDSHEHAGLQLTTTGVLAESSNTGTVMIGQDIPQQVRHDYLAKFGFGAQLGIELPNESKGLLHASDDWDGRTKYAVLFGQGVSVTALQATSVFATIANDGVRVQPHLIKGWTSADGTPAPVAPPVSTQVVSPQTADTVLTMLESAVDEGTGGNAAIPGYRVAGKTGTAQKFNPNGITASFIGVAPADDPRIAVGVFLQDPRSSEWGGTVAAPVFSDVAGFALQELGVAPSGVPAQLFPTTWE
ncbi:peptidoglycan D,D-transpeptidase FtsI family protein [Cellulomonas cellasea]|uniref:Cell division protein FtsI n=2 Tax=Cellulomonas cellasea TaxID=43670 RepID=A0A4Y3KXV2_9CELL|nr:penicillin-binding protein 2 [Cellulomonas cellasea]GEA88256.1 cell division protein FtsI [Cellulomonas cellasea]